MNGGKITASAPCKTLVYTDFARDVLISGVHIVLNPTVENFIADKHAHSGTKPFPIIHVGGGTTVSTRRTEGLCMYTELGDIGDLAQAHEDVVFDCVVEYKQTPPFMDPVFWDASKRNSATLRARLDRD